MISQSIVGTIKQVTKSILKLSSFKRDYTQRIHVTMNDEVKDLAEATNMLLENQEEIEWQQRKLAEVVHMLQGISDMETLGSSFITKAAELLAHPLVSFTFVLPIRARLRWRKLRHTP